MLLFCGVRAPDPSGACVSLACVDENLFRFGVKNVFRQPVLSPDVRLILQLSVSCVDGKPSCLCLTLSSWYAESQDSGTKLKESDQECE